MSKLPLKTLLLTGLVASLPGRLCQAQTGLPSPDAKLCEMLPLADLEAWLINKGVTSASILIMDHYYQPEAVR